MVEVGEEDLGVGVGLQWLTHGWVTLEGLDEDVLVGLATLVVDVATLVDIDAWGAFCSWLVEELAWVRVLAGLGDVVDGEHDDLALWDSVGLGLLVGVATIGVMSVVPVATGSDDDDSPVVTGGVVGSLGGGGHGGELHELLVHF